MSLGSIGQLYCISFELILLTIQRKFAQNCTDVIYVMICLPFWMHVPGYVATVSSLFVLQ